MSGLLPKTKPTLLRDVLALKRERGDDCADFLFIARGDFASQLNATIVGAEHQTAFRIARPQVSDRLQAKRVAFLADLRAVLAGEFGREAA